MRETLMRSVPAIAQVSDGRETVSAGTVFLRALHPQALDRLAEAGTRNQVWLEYPTCRGYVCSECAEGRNSVWRPPWDYCTILKHTSRVAKVPDNKVPGHYRVVFTERQRDKLVQC